MLFSCLHSRKGQSKQGEICAPFRLALVDERPGERDAKPVRVVLLVTHRSRTVWCTENEAGRVAPFPEAELVVGPALPYNAGATVNMVLAP